MSEIKRGIQPENDISLPLELNSKVQKGFGRGSKELGIPTANLPIEDYENELKTLPPGVYLGWAQVPKLGSKVYPMAMSIGWNPYYKNEKKTIEIHIINKFEEDFYGEQLKAIAVEYIRPELDFKSLDELVKAINDDIEFAEKRLKENENFAKLASHKLFDKENDDKKDEK